MRSQGAVCFFVPRTAPDRRDFDSAKGEALFSGDWLSIVAGCRSQRVPFLARLARGVSF